VLLLALDSSTPRVTVALVDVAADASTRVLAEHADDVGNRHGELLAPAIATVLAAVGAKPGDLGAIACGLGPGPFTGLRVGIVTAASLADGLNVPAYGACSLDALALAHRGNGRLLAVTDARRKQVYWALYDEDGRRVDGPEVSAPTEVPGNVDRVVGAGAIQGPAHRRGMRLGCGVLRNRSFQPVTAIQLRWVLVRNQDRALIAQEGFTPKTVLVEGHTHYIDLSIPGESLRRTDFSVISFADATRALQKEDLLEGDYILYVGLNEVRFADESVWKAASLSK